MDHACHSVPIYIQVDFASMFNEMSASDVFERAKLSEIGTIVSSVGFLNVGIWF